AIEKAASKGLVADDVSRLIDDLESSLRQSGVSEVPSQRIGEMVLERLAERDPLSYLRFKIVYSRLEDIDALYDELASLGRRRPGPRARRPYRARRGAGAHPVHPSSRRVRPRLDAGAAPASQRPRVARRRQKLPRPARSFDPQHRRIHRPGLGWPHHAGAL